MNQDVFDYHIHIEKFSNLLVWLIFICFAGLCLTGFPMLVMSRFFFTKTGSRFSIINMELPFSFTKFRDIIDGTSNSTKDTMRMNLKLDYYFMIFAYLLLFFAGWFVLQRQETAQPDNTYRLLWIPFIAWLFDILENKMALASLEKLSKAKARLLLVFSLVKWLLIAGYVLFMAAVYFGFVAV
jgi:hypothetical protein